MQCHGGFSRKTVCETCSKVRDVQGEGAKPSKFLAQGWKTHHCKVCALCESHVWHVAMKCQTGSQVALLGRMLVPIRLYML